MQNTGLIIGVVLVIVLLVLLLGGMGMMGFGMGPGMMGGFGMHGWGGTFGANPLGWILMLVLWGLLLGGLALVVVSLARNSRASSAAPLPPSASGESPLDILKARYARGEITKEQFNEIKMDLDG